MIKSIESSKNTETKLSKKRQLETNDESDDTYTDDEVHHPLSQKSNDPSKSHKELDVELGEEQDEELPSVPNEVNNSKDDNLNKEVILEEEDKEEEKESHSVANKEFLKKRNQTKGNQ